jgi:flavodoxin
MTKNLKIFYFSGTGNALAASNWIAEYFSERNTNTEIVKITPSLEINPTEFNANTLIGFCYPTHGFNAPPVVINFLLRFPKSKNSIFFAEYSCRDEILKMVYTRVERVGATSACPDFVSERLQNCGHATHGSAFKLDIHPPRPAKKSSGLNF